MAESRQNGRSYRIPRILRAGMWAAAMVVLVSCDSSTGPMDGGAVTISFAAVTELSAPANVAPARAPLMDDFGRTIDVETAQIVIAEVELERHDDFEACEDGSDDDDCEELEAGPVLVDLPLDGDVVTLFTTSTPEGTFEELELEFGSPDDDGPGTAEFFAENPAWPTEASVQVAGTFDAGDGMGPQAFRVYLDGEGEIEMDFEPPLVVLPNDPGGINVTVNVHVAEWFLGPGGLIDPAALSADDSLRSIVEDNIEASFEAFEDDDLDGEEDD